MKNNNICTPETLEQELANYKQSTKANATESANRLTHIKWLYTLAIILSSVIIFMLGMNVSTHRYTVVCENSNGLFMPTTIPTGGIENIYL